MAGIRVVAGQTVYATTRVFERVRAVSQSLAAEQAQITAEEVASRSPVWSGRLQASVRVLGTAHPKRARVSFSARLKKPQYVPSRVEGKKGFEGIKGYTRTHKKVSFNALTRKSRGRFTIGMGGLRLKGIFKEKKTVRMVNYAWKQERKHGFMKRTLAQVKPEWEAELKAALAKEVRKANA